MKDFSSRIAAEMIKRKIISAENVQLYVYGIKNLVFVIVNVSITILLGILFQHFLKIFFFLVGFILLRSFAGGFHLKSRNACILFSNLIAIFAIIWGDYIKLDISFSIVILLVSLLIVIKLAPLSAVNKPLDKAELLRFRIMSRIIAISETGLAFFFLFIKNYEAYWGLHFSIISTGTLLCISLILQKKNRKCPSI